MIIIVHSTTEMTMASILIPTIASISVFVIGIIIERCKEKKKKKEEDEKLRNAILQWISLLKTPIENQIDHLNKFAKRVSNATQLQPEIFDFPKSMASKINNLSVDRILDVFVTRTKNEHYDDAEQVYNIVNQTDFLSSIQNQIEMKYEEYKHRCVAYRQNWEINWKSLETLINKNSWSPQEQNAYLDIYNASFDLIKENRSVKNQSEIFDKTILPLYNQLQQLAWSNSSSILFNEYKSIITQLYNTIIEWESYKKETENSFYTKAQQIEKSYAILNQAKNHFSNNKG